MLTVVVIVSILAAIITPRWWLQQDKAKYAACGQNLKNIATALQTYANDNGQYYPGSLNDLVPLHLPVLPSCPAAYNADTYSSNYQQSTDPRNFTVVCTGSFHTSIGVNTNEPWYELTSGLNPK